MRPAPIRSVNRTAPQAWERFSTPIGWVGIGWTADGLAGVRMGYATVADLNSVIGDETVTEIPTWVQRLEHRLQAYCAGAADDFLDVPVATLWSTEFQRAVIAALRAVPYGATTTYRELAAQAGSPGASRAVGQVMATNPVPLVVPCHRVLGSGGKLGGFSAPTGTALKQQLLHMEAAHIVPAAESASASPRRPTAGKRAR